jgi:HAMP domain-containing protein
MEEKRDGGYSNEYMPKHNQPFAFKNKKQPQNTFSTIAKKPETKRTDIKIKPNRIKNNKNIKVGIRKKFNFALIFIMLISLSGTYITSNLLFKRSAEYNVVENARFLLTTMEASRSFTGEILKPALYKELPGKFVVEGMSSSFGARNIFERIKKKYPKYYFKHAAPNPRNRLNLADAFEQNVINSVFKKKPIKKEWYGYKGKEFVIMKPIAAKERCMKCHSVPEKAPIEVIEKYGDRAAFGMTVGDIIAALTVSVPASEIFYQATSNTIILNLIVTFCFIILIVIINLFFEAIVIKPINKLRKRVNEISVGELDTPVRAKGSDELSDLAKCFERMRLSVRLAISRLSNRRKSLIHSSE